MVATALFAAGCALFRLAEFPSDYFPDGQLALFGAFLTLVKHLQIPFATEAVERTQKWLPIVTHMTAVIVLLVASSNSIWCDVRSIAMLTALHMALPNRSQKFDEIMPGVLLTVLALSMTLPMLADIQSGSQDWKVFLSCIVITLFFGGSLMLSYSGQSLKDLPTERLTE